MCSGKFIKTNSQECKNLIISLVKCGIMFVVRKLFLPVIVRRLVLIRRATGQIVCLTFLVFDDLDRILIFR